MAKKGTKKWLQQFNDEAMLQAGLSYNIMPLDKVEIDKETTIESILAIADLIIGKIKKPKKR